LHGGAYCLGSAGMYRNIHDSMSRYTKARVFGLNYRLAPQYPFPCGLIDSVSGYLELRKRYPEASITLMGDSAGGGLVLATLLCLRDMKAKGWDIDMPKGAFCLSPWIDLTHSFPSFQLGDSNDYLPLGIVDSRLGDRKHYYTTNENLKNPYVSPLFAESFEGIPPVLLTVGSFEKLYDEVVELSNKLPSRQLEIYKSHVHVFQVFPMADAAELSLKRAAKFLDKCFQEKEIESLKIEYDFHGIKVSSESL
jgi:acetyl esterase/lipase